VPSCPEWTAADLLWHLAEVQMFWGEIVRHRLADPEPAEQAKPERPDDHADLHAMAVAAADDLYDVLAATPVDTPVWTWADDHSVGFVRRRQAHEALVHRLDAELTVGAVTGFDPALATDGVDEALRHFLGGVPPWGTFIADGTTGLVRSTDTGAAWALRLGRFRGTSPNSGTTYDEDTFEVDDASPGAAAAFVVAGSARDLDAWLWGRPTIGEVVVTGEGSASARLNAIVAKGVE
jgi:uncharacterized protein (TIGR03083 family)